MRENDEQESHSQTSLPGMQTVVHTPSATEGSAEDLWRSAMSGGMAP
ncbi:hypothetical protein D1BOALGB6SA_3695 [Olavius sp. associated proteobacterium Delta 1]|nr:hypothetical protein D1BOALGB6SA_3695 [Olavius sp. associated proteobacterium Delta 1]